MEQPPVQTSKQGIKYYNGSVNGGRGRGWQIHVPGDVCTLTLASAHFSQILDERVHRLRESTNALWKSFHRAPLRRTSKHHAEYIRAIIPCLLVPCEKKWGAYDLMRLERDERIINLIFSDTWICRFLNSVYQSVYC